MAIELPIGPLGYDDYAAIDDGNRYEVIDGKLVLVSAPSLHHQDLVGEFYIALKLYAKRTRNGKAFISPCDVVLRAERPGQIVQPDVLYVSKARADRLKLANVQGAPDLVVEVMSPANGLREMRRRLAIFADYGVQEVWIVPLHASQIEVLRLQPDGAYGRRTLFLPGEQLTSELLPGFELDVASLFELEDEE